MTNSSTTANVKTTVTIVLSEIKCLSTSERGHDELYLHYIADDGRKKRFPDDGYHSIKKEESWFVNLPISYKSTLVIELYDNDSPGDDFLGSCSYNAIDASIKKEKTAANTNGADYTLCTHPEYDV